MQTCRRAAREHGSERSAAVFPRGGDLDLVLPRLLAVGSTLDADGAEAGAVGTHAEDREHGNTSGLLAATDEHPVERLGRSPGRRGAPDAELRKLEVQCRLRRIARDLFGGDRALQCLLADA